jgi:hypothetical protein
MKSIPLIKNNSFLHDKAEELFDKIKKYDIKKLSSEETDVVNIVYLNIPKCVNYDICPWMLPNENKKMNEYIYSLFYGRGSYLEDLVTLSLVWDLYKEHSKEYLLLVEEVK